MARKKHKRKPKQGIPRPEWERFLAGWHGKGPHRDRSKYTRKDKHKGQADDQ